MITTLEPTEPTPLPHAAVSLTRHRGVVGSFDNHTKIVDFESSKFSTFAGTCLLHKGKFYYEIEVITMGKCTKFGWATSNFARASGHCSKGVGDDTHSWGIDGDCVRRLWGSDRSVLSVAAEDEFGSALKDGDILGLAIDLELRMISVSLNSHLVAFFVGIKLPRAAGVFPAISSQSGVYKINFGDRKFAGNPPDSSYSSVEQGSHNSDGNLYWCNNVFCNEMIDGSVCGQTICGGLVDFLCYETILQRCIVSPLCCLFVLLVNDGQYNYEFASKSCNPIYTCSCFPIVACCKYRTTYMRDEHDRNILHGSAASGSICALRLLKDCCCVQFDDDFVNTVDDKGNTPLHYATDAINADSGGLKYVSSNGRARVCRFLLRHGTDVHVRNDMGQTALDLCNDPVVRKVLETAVAVENRPPVNGFEYTAKMHFEAEHGEPFCCIEYCRNMNDQSGGKYPICISMLECLFIETLCLPIVGCPLFSVIMISGAFDDDFAIGNARLNILGVYSCFCPSFWAVLWSRLNGHKHLHVKDSDTDWTLLIHAAISGNYVMLRLLSMMGVKFEEDFINYKDRDGNTALHYCANMDLGFDANKTGFISEDGIRVKKNVKRSDKVLIARYLLANGADVQIQNNEGRTALDVCTSPTVREVLFEALLIQTGQIGSQQVNAGVRVKPNFMVDRGVAGNIANAMTMGVSRRVLLTACLDGQMDVVLACLNGSINVNCKDNKGFSPLLLALLHNHYDIARLLVAKGAIVINKDNVDKSPLDACISAIEKAYPANDSASVAAMTELFFLMAVTVSHHAKLDEFLWKIVSYSILNCTQLDQFYAIVSIEDTYAMWSRIVQGAGTDMTNDRRNIFVTNIANLASSYPHLIEIKDKDGRSVMEVASKPIKEVLRSLILWHGRYQLTETRPEHQSATCRVFKGVDTLVLDERGQPTPVALKLMAVKDQFNREVTARLNGQFDEEFVVNVCRSHPELITTGSTVSGMDVFPSVVEEENSQTDDQIRLTKANAERYFLVVMPLADRNLFVAMKQERWAGRNMEEVKHCFIQLVRCVDHMHTKGLLHADLKILNIVRIGGKWKLIDLDASCVIGQEAVGHKSSTAYCPPEVLYINQDGQVAVRSPHATDSLSTPLLAHPSFDVFSLGCILYQLCNKDVLPLFQGNQDDNLRVEDTGTDNDLWSLYEWSMDLKTRKLSVIDDPIARNLLSQMLHKDPHLRPTIARILAHPFLSSKSVARMIGDEAEFDVFLSYRVDSDKQHVEKLYHLLTAKGLKVWWDKLCLLPGVDWKEGFCAGLVNSKTFVCLLSKHAINHPTKGSQNFSKLTATSRGDNVFLEHRLALELQGLGLIEKIFPLFIGDVDPSTGHYSNYFGSGGHPRCPDTHVNACEIDLRHHMESQALGVPLEVDRTVSSVVTTITACQGIDVFLSPLISFSFRVPF